MPPRDPNILEPQSAIIPLRQGLDLKTAIQVVDPPAMLAAQSISLFSPGEISKDQGYETLPSNDLAGAALTFPLRRIIEHNSAQLIMYRDGLAEHSETANLFHTPANRTAIASSAAQRLDSPVITTTLIRTDYAVSGNYEMVAVTEQSGFLRVIIRERSSGTLMSSLAIATTVGVVQPIRCIAVGTTLICLWADGANLRATRWSSATVGTPLSAAVNIATNVNAAQKWIDAIGGATVGYVAYVTTVPTVVSLRFNATTLASLGSAGVAGTATQGVAICLDASENQLVAWCGAPGLSVFGVTPASANRGSSLVAAGLTAYPACVSNENGTSRGTVFGADAGFTLTGRHQVSFDGAGGSLASASLYGLFVSHRPVLIGALIWVGYFTQSTAAPDHDQHTLVTAVHRADNGSVSTADPVCWYMYGLAAAQAGPASVSLSNGEYLWVWPTLLQATYPASPMLLKLRPYEGLSVPGQTGAYVCNSFTNGQSGFYDASFGYAPAITGTSQQNVAGGLVPGQTYQYIAYYETILPDGSFVRSLTSLPVSVTITGLNDQVTLAVNTLLYREGISVYLRVARTLAGGTVFHVLTPTVPVVADARAAVSVNYVDGATDVTIATLPFPYTAGGVLDAYPQPMTRVLVLHQNRVFGIDENSNQLRYTREVLPGEAPAWHPTLAVDCTGVNVDPRALVSTAQGLWVMGRDRQTGAGAIALLIGQGAADDGSGSTYELQRLATADVGPDGARKAIATPLGILFEDPRQGIHLLPDGGGAPVFVGAPIEAQRSGVICMHVLHEKKEVRITQNYAFAPILIWHYDQNQWSLRAPGNGAIIPIDATVWSGQHVLLTDANSVLRQSDSVWLDGAIFQQMAITTAWIKTAGFSGLQRIWKLFLLGRWVSAHGLTINIQYDYNTVAPGDTFTFTSAEIDTVNAGGKYEVRISPRRQKCEAFRVTIADTDAGSGTRRGAAWVALRLEYGALRGPSRKPAFARKS